MFRRSAVRVVLALAICLALSGGSCAKGGGGAANAGAKAAAARAAEAAAAKAAARAAAARAAEAAARAAEQAAAAKAFAPSGNGLFRPAGNVLDDLAPQLSSHLHDVELASGRAPSRVLEARGVTLSSSMQGLSAAAVTESTTPLARLSRLMKAHGDDAYGLACEVIGAIKNLAENGADATYEIVWNRLGWRSPSLAYDIYADLYDIVYGPGSDAKKFGQLVIWASCLPADVADTGL
jgi:hypothetical protein